MKARRRLLLILGGAIAAATLAFDLIATGLLERTVEQRAVDRLQSEVDLLASQVNAGWPATTREADAWADRAGAALGLRVTLIDADGTVLGDSQVATGELPAMENHRHRPEIVSAAAAGAGSATRLSSSVGPEIWYVARRVGPVGSALGFVRLAVSASDLRATVGRYRVALTTVCFGLLSVLAGISYAGVRRFSESVAGIARAADRVAGGDHEAPIEHDSRDETGDLAVSVDRMRRALVDQIDRADAERRLLASILGGLREGILVVGPEREVILMNPAFKATMGVRGDPHESAPIFEVVRDRAITEVYDEALDRGAEVARRISIPGGGSFELIVVPFFRGQGRRAGAVGLFFDVTRLDALEKVRRDFVADVSHELRTPLASLKAALETLVGGAFQDAAEAGRFLDILTKNAARMEAILDDLTDLSLIETGAITLSPTPVDVGALAREAAAALAPRAGARRVRFELNLDPARVMADRRRIDQVLTNLLDNAVKFNREGGTVTVSTRKQGSTVLLTVEDTGPGIPPDALERIFNRFYRLDRSRSRDLPGTGLGLAIVKHLVRLHGGSIRAENREAGGACFLLELPAAP